VKWSAGYPLLRPPDPKQKEEAKILTGKGILYSINFPKFFVKPLRTNNHEAPCGLIWRGEVSFVRKALAKIC
jgi:hypothetical protein